MDTKDSDPHLLFQIAHDVSSVDVTEFPVWQELRKLSDQTTSQGVLAHTGSISVSGNDVRGRVTVAVGLTYKDNVGGQLTSSDSFPGTFEGHLDADKKVKVDKLIVDTSRFDE